ncbi:MAG: hypothetical protein E7329_09985 [Clostridiales bacterium]|nr:hypothetical protein [Clostridiales bacterium]
MDKEKQTMFYGRFARTVIFFARFFTRKYSGEGIRNDGPAVYVCRHLDMHGPIEAIVNFPFSVHALTLHVFLDKEACIRHFSDYTFSKRVGKKAGFWRRLGAQIAGSAIVPLMKSLQAVPVYRDSGEALKTMRQGLKWLEKGDSLMIWPDVEYTEEYGQDFEIYSGFLFLGELYHKRTGKELRFIPLVLDDETGKITQGDPVIVNDFKSEEKAAAQRIKRGIDKRSAIESVNSIQAGL